MDKMTPMERVVAALSHQEGDRVPFLLLTTLHPAKALGISTKEYFSKAENVVDGQLASQRKYGHDALYAFFYAPIEIEDWGAKSSTSGKVPQIRAGPSLEVPRTLLNCRLPPSPTLPV